MKTMRKYGYDNFKVELNHQRKGRERTNEKWRHPNVSQIDLLEYFKSIVAPDTFPVISYVISRSFLNYSLVVSSHIHKSFHEFIILDAKFIDQTSSYQSSPAIGNKLCLLQLWNKITSVVPIYSLKLL